MIKVSKNTKHEIIGFSPRNHWNQQNGTEKDIAQSPQQHVTSNILERDFVGCLNGLFPHNSLTKTTH